MAVVSRSYEAEDLAPVAAQPAPPVTRAYLQHFERGLIIYMRAPRVWSRDQWFVLYYEDERTQYWSFSNPLSLLGTEAPAYRPNGHKPPRGFLLPAVGFGRVWVMLKDLVGWALAPVESYEITNWRTSGSDPFAPPPVLPGPEGLRFILYPDRTWDVEAPEGISYSD